jgi:hypothetical protein
LVIFAVCAEFCESERALRLKQDSSSYVGWFQHTAITIW